jgi:xylulose-5-phosphate/fructose-6-phosphate phosphoketolase
MRHLRDSEPIDSTHATDEKQRSLKMTSTSLDASLTSEGPLSAIELNKMHAYWRASNYLSVGQIYLFDNPLLKQPLERKHIKPRLLGHWGTTPGLNCLFI